MCCFDRQTSRLASVFQPLLFLSILGSGVNEPIPCRIYLSVHPFIFCFSRVCFTWMLNTCTLEEMIRKTNRERATFLAETLRIACLNSPFANVRVVLWRCRTGLSAQQQDCQANQVAGPRMAWDLPVSGNPPRSCQALPSCPARPEVLLVSPGL